MPDEILSRFPFKRPARLDLEILQGASLTMMFGVCETIDPRVLINTAGWTARAKVKATYGGATLLDMTIANGRVAVGIMGTPPYQYNILIHVNATTTDLLADWGEGLWDLELEDPFGTVDRIVEGDATLSLGVTR